MDLYYRLHVFPVLLPPLRDRTEDIPLLAQYFIRRFAEKEKKPIEGLSEKALAALLSYSWPGNIRELENLMQRCVLLADSPWIETVPLPANPILSTPGEGQAVKTMAENERDHILSVLEKTNGKIFGPDGAARLLDINGSTLQSRMKKLGIDRKAQ
jgi:transcriptional regulator with GAF, ATPase, and Fis domain